jgi:hypothetical protein
MDFLKLKQRFTEEVLSFLEVYLEKVLAQLKVKKNKTLNLEKERLALLPFVSVTEFEVRGVRHLMLEAQKTGTLADMIREGLGIELPRPVFVTASSYLQNGNDSAGQYVGFLEEKITAILQNSSLAVSLSAIGRILNQGLATKKLYHSTRGVLGRVANIFVRPTLQHYMQIGDIRFFAPTLYTGLYAPGTRIFLRAPTSWVQGV